ncbi:DEAD/DEAH box helicase family protein [Synechococcus sp. Cruz-9H2]|uniref:EcoAI/FtnUII family type I restriction enzme subunit R n=1 Tax=unclassified Synechococcus TaxID=2626047 RepID=UPI0020CBFF9F|nr:MULTISPECIES: type I restriction endonuclease subunit R [unclassified Synechococcus]MCP9818598.1 DEAD/DEAH box helicase family protein [Synechococcus sp. Cruz-9H2]MCP9842828.1 DEAD/DEAH box helicase family protein [Synechococcus sp. Edmonson 11F2]MCP9855494.1 DEAD/DEAH box helicase family protein [Synechococcus sp. Cruz-9C9]MCP9862260.1 DEAD/DEAH box helicase family protein [Synechococcus sp. Cruz-7E5]MCP9869531.1 DEAD/DEAH box helicase family protein [Synechococcus sp. Cruz-7B9]
MNEAETRAELIDPLLAAAGWGVVEGSRIRREFSITQGRLQGGGRRGKSLSADYVLIHRNTKLAVVEAKADSLPLSEGVGQAKEYAAKLQIRFTYASNGKGVYAIDRATGEEGEVDGFPSPQELWQRTFAVENAWRDRFAAIPYPDKGGSWQIRFYQEIAVTQVLEAIAAGRNRILLTLATGTGKTSIAFQILWKLFAARWNLSGAPTRRPRILFLADRNNLADQAFNDFTAFAAFEENALARIEPGDLRKRGRVPTNASVFLTIFQTFMSGPPVDGKPSPWFGQYPPDFFDFIVIDECHRGGANNESTWRGILEYFAPAVQLGLTATPRRQGNTDTYAYFGEPVYSYSLKEGINDGFLTPFRVKQISTTLDEYIYTPDDTVVEGEIEAGKLYKEADFNKIIEIERRERERVRIFMEQIDQRQKAIVFCATQDHALAIRDLINQLKSSTDPNYCQRVTANDGELGNTWLRAFQDNEKTIPTILTTSQKLSTGVDARNVRAIVLLRPVNSMIEFKQIIGRGTRLFDGKDYFTIYDFVKAHHHFSDPEWDGVVEPDVIDRRSPSPADPTEAKADVSAETEEPEGRPPRPAKVCIKLGDGKERSIQHMLVTSFWHPDGRPMSSQQFIECLYGQLPEFVKDEAELRELWSAPDTRRRLLQGLEEKGFGAEQLAEMQRIIDAENSDLFDVLAHVAYALPPIPREQRAGNARLYIHSRFTSKQQVFLNFVLQHYVSTGVQELAQEKLTPLLRLRYQNSIADAVADLGRPEDIGQLFSGFQRYLYEATA